jgi:large subunit ribosomal protein L5e
MGFVKVVKNKAYHSRIQTKPRRRREGKTDYFARHRLVLQAKNKYASKKYRLVVRRTNTKFILQIVYSRMDGDIVMCAAESTELKNYGLTAGLTNYSAAYCTGLLIARRLLKKVGLDSEYGNNTDVTGEYFNVADDEKEDKRPFKALLDVGIHRTTTGARVFGCLKGAADGGLNVPHSTKRFPGYTKAKVEEVVNKRGKATGETERQAAKFEAGKHKERIFGNHIFGYMTQLKKENKEKYMRQFKRWDKCLTDNKAKSCEELYKKVHAAIVKSADRKKVVSKAVKPTGTDKKEGSVVVGKQYKCAKAKGTWLRHIKLSKADKEVRVAAKMQMAVELVQNS